MSGSHEKLPKLFWIQIILVAIVGTMYLLAPKAEKHDPGSEASETNHKKKSVTENLHPVGKVAVTSDSASNSSSTAKSGEAIYNETCQTCHKAGIANAPKLDDKAAWEPRIAAGLDSLMKTAINGKGAMPPKGGKMTLSDDEIKSTVVYMAKQAGFDLSSSAKPATTDKPKEAASTEKSSSKEDNTVVQQPEAPKKKSTPTPPAAPVPPSAPETTANAESATITTAATPSAPSSPDNSAAGEKTYKNACFTCHDTGVAGSPKIADTTVWAPRIATGLDALYNSAIKGKGVMPPKGGNSGLSDENVKAAVDYIVSKSQ